MKATGIVRRIDDLGRVVIPKEIRRTMRIREGDPLEIYTDAGGEVIFKKYSPIGELAVFAGQYAEALVKSTNLSVLVCDRDHCIAASGISKKDVIEKPITTDIEQVMESRKLCIFKNTEKPAYAVAGCAAAVCAAVPIISAGDIVGAVILLANETANEATETDLKLAQVAAAFLGKQMEE